MVNGAAPTLCLIALTFQMALCQSFGNRGLRCYHCEFNQPCTDSTVVCKEDESCATVKGNSDFKVHDSIFRKGCILSKKCGSQDKISYWKEPYRVRYSCCNTDLCNTMDSSGATHTSVSHFPLLLIAMALAVLLTFFS